MHTGRIETLDSDSSARDSTSISAAMFMKCARCTVLVHVFLDLSQRHFGCFVLYP
jgi:hypothetical protein